MKRKNRNRFAVLLDNGLQWSQHKSRRAAQKSLENAHHFGHNATVAELIGD